jgi:hypothetical protein
MHYQIQDFYNSLSDPRRGQGQRHSLENILTIVLMAILSGYNGLRGFARFASSNEAELTSTLKLKHGVPCYYTFHSVLSSLNEQIMAQKFIDWMQTYPNLLTDEYVALDGKVVASTVNGGNTSSQSFVSVVSAFGHQTGLVYGSQTFENGKSGENKALCDLIEKLGLKGTTFTADALHTQKKRLI